MSDMDIGLVNQYLTRVNQLAVKAQDGADITGELGTTVAEAVDHFAVVYNPAAQLEGFIGQLKYGADLIREKSPAHAEVLLQAAAMASRASAGPET